MTESDAKDVLLLRAVETAAQPEALGWRDADRRWASDEAARQVGSAAGANVFIATRARLGLDRWLATSSANAGTPRVLHALRRGVAPGWALAFWAAAFVLGLAGDTLSAHGGRLNLLAPPLLALCLWNLAVYAALALAASRSALAAPRRASAGSAAAAAQAAKGWMARGAAWAAVRRAAWLRRAAVAGEGGSAAALAQVSQRFVSDWTRAAAVPLGHRAALWLHVGAAALALGLLAAMYARGLVADFRAGWDSTFLGASQVHALLHAVLGPAAALLGWPLPDAAQLAALRWADGSAGEPAARWLHLHALTALGVVVAPRLLLALWQGWRARQSARDLDLTMDDAYFSALRRAAPAEARPVLVLPYSLTLASAQHAGLAAALVEVFGNGAAARLAPSAAQGAEDQPASAWLPLSLAELPDDIALLYALAATPERETHAAFGRVLAAALPPRCTLTPLIEQSAYRQRLGRAGDAAQRLAQRRAAWTDTLTAAGLPAPRFIDLAAEAAADRTTAAATVQTEGRR